MTRCPLISLVPALIWLSPATPIPAESLQSTPEISVFVYGFPGLSGQVIQGAEAEAAYIFRQARIQLRWTNCLSKVTAPALCFERQTSAELAIRFTPKALPSMGAKALGAALFSSVGDSALVFYDRIALLPTYMPLHILLGRVLAHEITHLLIRDEEHSSSGLMRANWSLGDLRFASIASLWLDPFTIQRIREEVHRRALAASERVGK